MPKKATTNGELEAANPAEDIDLEIEMGKIVTKNREVNQLAAELALAKEGAKIAKEAWEVASTELSGMISELGREYPLFEGRGA